jgi:hypothetical protein
VVVIGLEKENGPVVIATVGMTSTVRLCIKVSVINLLTVVREVMNVVTTVKMKSALVVKVVVTGRVV